MVTSTAAGETKTPQFELWQMHEVTEEEEPIWKFRKMMDVLPPPPNSPEATEWAHVGQCTFTDIGRYQGVRQKIDSAPPITQNSLSKI